MRTNSQFVSSLAAVTLIVPAVADTIYSNLLDTAIPTTFTGVTVTVDGGTFNPFFGGVGVANNSALQPVRAGTGGLDTILNLAVGSTIDAGSLYFATGDGGSFTHLGTTFTAGTEGYLGLKLNGADYGWMRVVFTNNTAGAVIKDWAYDNSGAAIVVGRVQQSAASGSAQTVTLSPGAGEAFTLGSQITDTGGNTNSVVKSGAGTATLTGTNTYTGTTTINAGILAITGTTNSGSGAVTVNNSGTKLTGSGTVGGNTTINSDAILAPGSGGVGKVGFANNLTAGSASIFEWQLAGTPAETGRGTGYDAVNVAGALGGGGAIFRVALNGSQDFSESFWNINRTWTDIFMTADGGTNVGFASLFSSVQYYNGGGAVSPAGQGAFTMAGNTLSWTAVPEPTGALAGLLLGASLLRRRRATPD